MARHQALKDDHTIPSHATPADIERWLSVYSVVPNPKRRAFIIWMRVYADSPMTLAALGRVYGITPNCVRLIEVKGLVALRTLMERGLIPQ